MYTQQTGNPQQVSSHRVKQEEHAVAALRPLAWTHCLVDVENGSCVRGFREFGGRGGVSLHATRTRTCMWIQAQLIDTYPHTYTQMYTHAHIHPDHTVFTACCFQQPRNTSNMRTWVFVLQSSSEAETSEEEGSEQDDSDEDYEGSPHASTSSTTS